MASAAPTTSPAARRPPACAYADGIGVAGHGTVTKAGYRAYINSPEWAAVRARYWASKLPHECYVCDAPRQKGMHLHHRTYKNLGAERLMDLMPVCPTCHDLIHHLHRTDAAAARNGLWGATKRARAMVQKDRPRRR